MSQQAPTQTLTQKRIPVVYLGGRFRGPKLADVDRNIAFASMFVAPIAEVGAMPVTVHLCEGTRAHDVQQENNGAWWLDATLEVLRRCDALVVLPGWQTSSGTIGEIKEAFRLGRPVFQATWERAIGYNDLPTPAHPSEWERVRELCHHSEEPYFKLDAYAYNFENWVKEVSK